MTKTPGRLSSRITLVALALAVALPGRIAAAQCVADLNGDRIVDGADLGILLNAWGTCPNGNPGCTGDLDSDGSVSGGVDGADLGILLAAWGNCPAPVVPSWATLIEAQPDPAVVTDPALRAAISATGFAWRVRDARTEMEMLIVPPGAFEMGCSVPPLGQNCPQNELPAHDVTLTNAFYLGRFEVTLRNWNSIMTPPSQGGCWPDDQAPKAVVSWERADAFLRAAGMRFPTEAEWEFACRAGTQTPYSNGSSSSEEIADIAWYRWTTNNCACYWPVGLLNANALGFQDMHGNVWEWVGDWYGPFLAEAQVNPTGPTSGALRVLRGGYFCSLHPTSSLRSGADPHDCCIEEFGLRAARDP